jgi:hypothetical protein
VVFAIFAALTVDYKWFTMGLTTMYPLGELGGFTMTARHTTTLTPDNVGRIRVEHRGTPLGVTADGPGGLLPLLAVGVAHVRARDRVGELVEDGVADVLGFHQGTVYEYLGQLNTWHGGVLANPRTVFVVVEL